jgi:hypothetical protein
MRAHVLLAVMVVALATAPLVAALSKLAPVLS